jgi:hypothetical protein
MDAKKLIGQTPRFSVGTPAAKSSSDKE